jgi:hypothetical protein
MGLCTLLTQSCKMPHRYNTTCYLPLDLSQYVLVSLLAGDVWKRCLAQGVFTSSHDFTWFRSFYDDSWWFIMMLIQMFTVSRCISCCSPFPGLRTQSALQSSSCVRAPGREVVRQSVEDRGSTGSSAVSYMGLSGISVYRCISYISEMDKAHNFNRGNDDKPIFSFCDPAHPCTAPFCHWFERPVKVPGH